LPAIADRLFAIDNRRTPRLHQPFTPRHHSPSPLTSCFATRPISPGEFSPF
jgi:hypothetical protein